MGAEATDLSEMKKRLDALYRRYNRREMVHPDPLEFLYRYPDPSDREIVALIAATLAYGRVKQILKSVESILAQMPHPRAFLSKTSERGLRDRFADFKHRFSTGSELSALLMSIKRINAGYGSLQDCFLKEVRPSDTTAIPALSQFVRRLSEASGHACGSLLASPADGSACKRLNLFLRWLVRSDEVDPGGWEAVGAHRLVMPLDTHINRITRRLGLTERKQADLRTALEITGGFQRIAPGDPVKYDFALCRLGIHPETDEEEFFRNFGRRVINNGGKNMVQEKDGSNLAAGLPHKLDTLVLYAPDSIVSRTIVENDAGTITLFAFDAGQSLSEHSAPFDAFVQVLDGEASLTIGGKEVRAKQGELVIMPANVPHAVKAINKFKMLLIMLAAR